VQRWYSRVNNVRGSVSVFASVFFINKNGNRSGPKSSHSSASLRSRCGRLEGRPQSHSQGSRRPRGNLITRGGRMKQACVGTSARGTKPVVRELWPARPLASGSANQGRATYILPLTACCSARRRQHHARRRRRRCPSVSCGAPRYVAGFLASPSCTRVHNKASAASDDRVRASGTVERRAWPSQP